MFEKKLSAKTVLKNTIDFFQCDSEQTKKRVLLIGGFHGDEPEGVYLLQRFMKIYAGACINAPYQIGVVPCLNPDGYSQNTRENFNKIDLNRNYPTRNFASYSYNPHTGQAFSGQPASECETRFMMNVVELFKPDMILSIHSDLKLVDYDGPAKEWAERISDLSGYPLVQNVGYETPGSFGTWIGIERQIPIVTLETESACDRSSQEKLWHRLEAVFLSFLK